MYAIALSCVQHRSAHIRVNRCAGLGQEPTLVAGRAYLANLAIVMWTEKVRRDPRLPNVVIWIRSWLRAVFQVFVGGRENWVDSANAAVFAKRTKHRRRDCADIDVVRNKLPHPVQMSK